MDINLFGDRPLFKECVEILNAEILSWEESETLTEAFEKSYPIAPWGKVDWENVKNKLEIGYEPEDIMPAFYKLLYKSADTSVYILCDDAMLPLIKTNLTQIIKYYDYVTCISPHKFIFNPFERYIIEILSGGKITIGIVPKN